MQATHGKSCLPCVGVSVCKCVSVPRTLDALEKKAPTRILQSSFLPSFSQTVRDEPGYDRAPARAASDLILEPLPSTTCTNIPSYTFFLLYLCLILIAIEFCCLRLQCPAIISRLLILAILDKVRTWIRIESQPGTAPFFAPFAAYC